MDFPSAAISEFKTIFEGEFKQLLSDNEARERAEAFMRVVILILRPLPNATHAMKNATPGVDGLPTFDTLARNLPVTTNSPQ